jgi:hypothetical protein
MDSSTLSKFKIAVLLIATVATIVLLIVWRLHDQRMFTKDRWRETAIGPYNHYPGREATVDDLIRNYHLKQRNYRQIINLLGKPDMRKYNSKGSEMQLTYEIVLECVSDIDPNHSKDLIIVFNSPDREIKSNQRVKYWYINEWYSSSY